MCQYSHCSFGALPNYYKDGMITLYADGQQLLIYILSIFVFTKIYEGVVTVNGEDLEDNDRIYYNLAYDSLELQFKILEFLRLRV